MRSGEPNHLLRLEQQQARLRLHHSTDADGVGLTQERPCTRCIKRNIGHLCHDEPREQAKRPKSEHHDSTGEDETSLKHEDPPANGIPQTFTQQQTDQPLLPESGLRLGPNRPVLNRIIDPPRPVAPTLGPGNQVQASKNGAQYREPQIVPGVARGSQLIAFQTWATMLGVWARRTSFRICTTSILPTCSMHQR